MTATARRGALPQWRGARRGADRRRDGRRLAAQIAGCLAAAAVILVVTPRPVTPIGIPVGYHRDLAELRRVAPYPVLAPAALPAGWQPVSSRLTVGAGGGPVSWHLGFVTPSGRMASLEESTERPGRFIVRMTSNGDVLPPVWAGGQSWARRVRKDKDQRSMYRSAPGAFTVVLTGTSGWQELMTLAGSLRVQS